MNAALGETLVLELLGVGAMWSRSEAASPLVPPICSGQAVLSLVKQGKLHSQLLPLDELGKREEMHSLEKALIRRHDGV